MGYCQCGLSASLDKGEKTDDKIMPLLPGTSYSGLLTYKHINNSFSLTQRSHGLAPGGFAKRFLKIAHFILGVGLIVPSLDQSHDTST